MNQFGYAYILEEYLKPFVENKFSSVCYLIQDNDPKHTSRRSVSLLKKNSNLKWLKTPPNCPDINIIELVWAELKNYIRRKNCKTSEEISRRILNYKITIEIENYLLSIHSVKIEILASHCFIKIMKYEKKSSKYYQAMIPQNSRENNETQMEMNENDKNTKEFNLTLKFKGSDLEKYFETKGDKNDYEGLLEIIMMVKKDLSIMEIKLYKKLDIVYLLVKVKNKTDFDFLSRNGILKIYDIRRKLIMSLTLVKSTQMFILAVKGVSVGPLLVEILA
ncbi:unnamed protein product [Brachionus calyciflorus]|uniref:Tc1-like transposase DDE domain-containing protein n=1 Tax=Brachionus calyciflorus TaxID=104777 RepID=A0A814H3R2_9BILA|nr:unnamed protein product [Brachionus calyciflorus]